MDVQAVFNRGNIKLALLLLDLLHDQHLCVQFILKLCLGLSHSGRTTCSTRTVWQVARRLLTRLKILRKHRLSLDRAEARVVDRYGTDRRVNAKSVVSDIWALMSHHVARFINLLS